MSVLINEYRQSSADTGFLNIIVFFGTLLCPYSTKSLLHQHGFLLTRLFFQSLKKQCKQRTDMDSFRDDWGSLGDDWGSLGITGDHWGSLGLIGNKCSLLGLIGDD